MLPLLLLWRRIPPRAVTPVFLGLWFAATSSSTSLSSILPPALDRPVATLLAATRCKRFACSSPWQEAPKMMSRRKKQVVRPLGPTCCPPKISSIRTPSGCSACTSSLSQPREALKATQIETFLRLRFVYRRIWTVSCTSLHHLARTTCKRVTSHRLLLLRHPTDKTHSRGFPMPQESNEEPLHGAVSMRNTFWLLILNAK